MPDSLTSLLLCIFIVRYVGSSCTFPSELTGIWYSSHKGALNFTDTQVLDYPIFMSASIGSLDFNCDANSGSKYLLKSTVAVFAFGSLIEAYVCIDLHRVSTYKYYYYLGTKKSSTNNDYVYGRPNGTSVSLSMACNRATPYDERTFITLVQNDSVSLGVAEATCPTELLASYSSLTYFDHDGSNACAGNTVTGCLDHVTLNYTYQSCAISKVFSSGGKFTCLKSVTKDDTKYLSVWNLDDTVDDTNTYRFTCLALKKSGTTLYATEYPKFCSDETQDSTTVASPGIKLTVTSSTATCSVSVTSVSNPGWVILILVLVLLAVGGVVVAIYLIKKRKPRIAMLDIEEDGQVNSKTAVPLYLQGKSKRYTESEESSTVLK